MSLHYTAHVPITVQNVVYPFFFIPTIDMKMECDQEVLSGQPYKFQELTQVMQKTLSDPRYLWQFPR